MHIIGVAEGSCPSSSSFLSPGGPHGAVAERCGRAAAPGVAPRLGSPGSAVGKALALCEFLSFCCVSWHRSPRCAVVLLKC